MIWRRRLEQSCRALAVTALIVALLLQWRTGVAKPREAGTRSVSTLPSTEAGVVTLLREVLRASVPDTIHRAIGRIPARDIRQLLGTFVIAGYPFTWDDRTEARGFAASMFRVPGPDSAWRLVASTAPGARVRVSDEGGLLDSLDRARTPVMGWRLAHVAGPLQLHSGRQTVTMAIPDGLEAASGTGTSARPLARRVRLLATAGWEAKFVTAALEEGGWTVDGRMTVSPQAATLLGGGDLLDPSTTAAVVVLDSALVNVGAVERFVRRGGGLLLSAEAAARPEWRGLALTRVGAFRPGIAGALQGPMPREGLEIAALTPEPGAQVLIRDTVRADGRERTEPRVVARRAGDGRVVVTGYRDSWRWRMQGGDDGARAHRRWWLGLLEASVGAGSIRRTDSTGVSPWPGDDAPYADLVARVGPPSASAPVAAPTAPRSEAGANRLDSPQLQPLLFLLALAALLTEWGSRRLRGAR